eukprot:TRINITY_DN32778_c0_g1_i2.p1 TRINITY_DN32778_c0_g1~~TRINITY_DN32778_c0_g1_i2.p1  ORF type:complete len:1236 (+),score=212.72 TRINITY_DN32778_c0_g1_i2:75-3782(+)
MAEPIAEAIKVALRVRPSFRHGDAKALVDSEELAVLTDSGQVRAMSNPPKDFSFDYTYCASGGSSKCSSLQEVIFDDIGVELVDNALTGYNSSLIAYGQTGSGKSYTVLGIGEAEGLVPRAVDRIFQKKVEYERRADKEIKVWVSFVEIYNERVRDLLAPAGCRANDDMKIIDHPEQGSIMPNATEAHVAMQTDVRKLLHYGMKARVTAATQMNATSSRSHAVFTLKVQLLEGLPPEPGQPDNRKVLTAKMNLADLAGSERQAKTGAEGTRLKEGCAINQSLSTLSLIIKDLSENVGKKSHKATVAFRSSKLTFLLKDSLAGNSRSCMVACVSPAMSDLSESISTLRFASSVKKIKTKAKQNKEESQTAAMESLKDEIKKLKEQLAHAHDNDHDLDHLQDLLAYHSGRINPLQDDKHAALDHGVGATNDLISQAFKVDKKTPYLLNMSDDPLIAGCLLYYLGEGEVTTIGSAEDNKVCLSGIGISAQLCEVRNTGNFDITIKKLGDGGRLCINGKLVGTGQSRKLRHGDKVYLGRVLAFKVVVPGDTSSPMKQGHGLSLEGLEHEWMAIEESETWGSLHQYLDQVLPQIPQEQALMLSSDMKKAWTMCEEAKEITEQCRPNEGLSFEVDLTSSIPSSVVIRVLQASHDEPDYLKHAPLYLWSVPKMAERIERMRDYYEDWRRLGVNKMPKIDPLLDPWHEPHPGAIESRLEELGISVVAERAYADSLRNRAHKVTGKAFSVWLDDNRESRLRNSFNSWHAEVKACKKAKAAAAQKKSDATATADRRPNLSPKAMARRSSTGVAAGTGSGSVKGAGPDTPNGTPKAAAQKGTSSFASPSLANRRISIADKNAGAGADDSRRRRTTSDATRQRQSERERVLGLTGVRPQRHSTGAEEEPGRRGARRTKDSAQVSNTLGPASPSASSTRELKSEANHSDDTYSTPAGEQVEGSWSWHESWAGGSANVAQRWGTHQVATAGSVDKIGEAQEQRYVDTEDRSSSSSGQPQARWLLGESPLAASENLILRKQLEDAFHLCEVLTKQIADLQSQQPHHHENPQPNPYQAQVTSLQQTLSTMRQTSAVSLVGDPQMVTLQTLMPQPIASVTTRYMGTSFGPTYKTYGAPRRGAASAIPSRPSRSQSPPMQSRSINPLPVPMTMPALPVRAVSANTAPPKTFDCNVLFGAYPSVPTGLGSGGVDSWNGPSQNSVSTPRPCTQERIAVPSGTVPNGWKFSPVGTI